MHLRLLLILICVFSGLSTARADIGIAVDTSSSTNANVGVGPNQTINLFLRETAPSSGTPTELTAITPFFQISAPLTVAPVVSLAPVGPTDSGSGFFGDGNLNASGVTPSGNTIFGINQEFNNPQLLTSTPELWLSISIDTTGIAPGVYQLDILDQGDDFSNVVDPTAPIFFDHNDNLTFTVVAVPEPSSALLVVGIAMVVASRRRKIAG